MKKVVTLGILFLLHSNVLRAGEPEADKLLIKVKNVAKESFSADIRKVASRISDGICGASGPSYIVEYQVRRWERSSTQGEFNPKWVVLKKYGISENDLARQGAPVLMDSETCAE